MKKIDKILVVDDEESVRNLCLRTLKKGNCDVSSASSGDNALELLRDHSFDFDLVITDIMMPGTIDGKGLLAQVKTKSPQTDVILMAANPTVESAVLALKEGAYDYLIKPFDPLELDSAVSRCLEKRHLKMKLDQAYKDLKTLSDSREMIMQLLVHDMKNPLSGIMGNAQIVLMDHLNQEQEATLKDILGSSQRLHHMIINLLEIGKMEEGRLVPNVQPVKVVELFNEIAKIMGSQFEHKNIKFSARVVPEDIVLLADRDLMVRLLQNLLENSLHYTFEYGIVELFAYVRENVCFVSVRDNGQPVQKEFRESIFTRYGRMTKSGERTNSGLGLYFCKLAAEAHGGTIELGELKEGCAFLITLPQYKGGRALPVPHYES
ncbi:MAG: response regulator [Elusimicrobia bacterium]|nr:response regulator [Candidatus Obscuribacterium magneticum]